MVLVVRGSGRERGSSVFFSSLWSPSAWNYSCLSLTLMTLTLLKLMGQPFCRPSLSLALSAVSDHGPQVRRWGQHVTEVMPCSHPSCWVHSGSIVLFLAVATLATYRRSASFFCCKVAFSLFPVSVCLVNGKMV